MAEVAEPNLETEPFRLGAERTAKHMVPFKPLPRVADEASVCVLLDDAVHSLTPHSLESCYLVWSLYLDAKMPCLVTNSVHEDAHLTRVEFA